LQPNYASAPREPTLERAQAAADTAVKLDPELSEAWVSSGLIAGAREQYERAQQMHRTAIELNPNNALAFKFYGNALTNAGNIDEGLQAFTRAASLDPLSAIVQVNLADGLQQHGRFQEAAMHYRRAIEIEPAMPHPYASMGSLSAYAWNRFADAVPLVTRAVELDPDSPIYPPSLVFLYLELGDDSQARTIISRAAQRWPDNADIELSLAAIDLLRRDDAGATRHAERSLALYPSGQGALRLLRNADLQSGNYDRALARYRQAYPDLFAPDLPVLDISNYEVAVDLAPVLQRRGDTARAKVLLDAAERAIGKLPRLGQAGFWLEDVQIHALRGDNEKALAALREAERAGWRAGWLYYRDFDPCLASIRNEPEFKAVFADIERDMARQRAELAARPKDAPLNRGTVD